MSIVEALFLMFEISAYVTVAYILLFIILIIANRTYIKLKNGEPK